MPGHAIDLPVPGLVLLVGPAGAGKSTFAARHFRATEIVSSDHCRALVSDSERSQAASRDAFRLLHELVALRLGRCRLTVVDAVNVDPYDRRPLLDLAREHASPAVATVFDLPLEVCLGRAAERAQRTVRAEVVRRQWEAMMMSVPGLGAEAAVAAVHLLRSAQEVHAVELGRVRPILPAG